MKRKIMYAGAIALIMIATLVPIPMINQPAKASFIPQYEADVSAESIILTTWPISTNTNEDFKARVYNAGPDKADVKVIFKFEGQEFGQRYIFEIPVGHYRDSDAATKYWPGDFQWYDITIEVYLVNGGYDPDGTDNDKTTGFRALFPGNN